MYACISFIVNAWNKTMHWNFHFGLDIDVCFPQFEMNIKLNVGMLIYMLKYSTDMRRSLSPVETFLIGVKPESNYFIQFYCQILHQSFVDLMYARFWDIYS